MYILSHWIVAVISGDDGSGEPAEKHPKFEYGLAEPPGGNMVPENTMVINTARGQEVMRMFTNTTQAAYVFLTLEL